MDELILVRKFLKAKFEPFRQALKTECSAQVLWLELMIKLWDWHEKYRG